MKIVCIGDSLTYGFGVPKESRWTNLLQEKLSIKVLNKGMNGDTTAGMLSRSYRDVIETYSTHTILMGGTNDFIKGYSAKVVFENIIELVKEATSYNIIPIIAIQIPTDVDIAKKLWSSYTDFSKVNAEIETFRQLIVDYSNKNNIQYIDFYKEFSTSIIDKNIDDYYIDGIHPTIKGHEILVNIALKQISNIM